MTAGFVTVKLRIRSVLYSIIFNPIVGLKMNSRIEAARLRAATLIRESTHYLDATKLVELRKLQEQISNLKNRNMFGYTNASELSWVDDWRPKLDE